MKFKEAILICLSKYFVFSGRASRPEHWWWMLFVSVGILLCSEINEYLATAFFYLICFIPTISVSVRRYHDINKDALWCLLPFTIIGLIPHLYFMMQPSASFSTYESRTVTFKKINFSIQEIVKGIPIFFKKLYKKKITMKVPKNQKRKRIRRIKICLLNLPN